MVLRADKQNENFLIRTVKQSALSWGISLVIHLLLIGGLMYYTFTHVQSVGQGQSESFTVELGPDIGAEASQPIFSVASDTASPIATIETPPVPAEIMLTKVESSDYSPPAQQSELVEAMVSSQGFSESLAEGDTGGAAGFFGLSAGGSSFVYVIDCSGSMAGEKLAAALNELRRSVMALDVQMKFYLVFYNDTDLPMPATRLVEANSGNKRKYLNWTESVTGSGGTNPLDAVKLAVSLKPDAIWLLSDGIFSADMVDNIARANPGRIPIHTLAFGSEADVQQLQDIAASNNGKFRVVSFGR